MEREREIQFLYYIYISLSLSLSIYIYIYIYNVDSKREMEEPKQKKTVQTGFGQTPPLFNENLKVCTSHSNKLHSVSNTLISSDDRKNRIKH